MPKVDKTGNCNDFQGRMLFRKNQPEPLSLRDEIRATRKAGIRTAIIVTLLISGVVPAFTLFWGTSETDSSLTARFQTVFAVVLQTYPLTLAIALITFSRRQKWFQMRIGNWFFAGSVVVFCSSLGNFLSRWTGHGWIAPANLMQDRPNSIFGIPAAVINTMGGFYQAYGFSTFVAAVLVGVFAGRTASRFVRRLPRNRNDSIALVKEIAEAQRDAA